MRDREAEWKAFIKVLSEQVWNDLKDRGLLDAILKDVKMSKQERIKNGRHRKH